MNRYIAVLSLALVCAGCATSYAPSGFRGGYKEVQLAPDVFRVTFQGNGYSGKDRVQDFATLRAADLTLQNGFAWFVIVGGYNDVTQHQFAMGGSASTSGNVDSSGHFTATTDYSPGQVYTINRPVTQMTIRCFKDKPAEPNAFDAAFVVKSLKKNYGLK